jgi:Fuc2NAc and GlcNAc transferase
MSAVAIAAVAFATSLLLVGAVRLNAARFGMLDLPNARSSHQKPTPRGGGIAIAIVTLLMTTAGWAADHVGPRVAVAWLAGGFIVATAGFIDDLRGLSARTRLALHFLAAALLLGAAGGLPTLPWPGGSIGLGHIGWIIGALAVVWSINLFNFMDGIDGLAAMQAVFVTGAAVLLQGSPLDQPSLWPLLALCGSALAFLAWNLPPARIFMGDVGSGFIGFAIAAGALLGPDVSRTTVWTWVILHGLFIADATATLVVRLLRREQVFEAHRSHLYQRLATRYRSHGLVTCGALLSNLLWFLPWAMHSVRHPASGPVDALVTLAPVVMFSVFSRRHPTVQS